jgi:hypothetical protein
MLEPLAINHRSAEPVEARFKRQRRAEKRRSPSVAFGATGSGLRYLKNLDSCL